MTIAVATRNPGKLREMRALFRLALPHLKDVQLVGLKEFADVPPIEEQFTTFHENARHKALVTANYTGLLAIGDDSGLVVDALDGAPGVYSARYAGPDATDDANNRKLLEALRNVPDNQRSAHFVCVIAVALPHNVLGLFEGACHGMIAHEPHGGNGFGYDPLFMKPDYGKSFAELPASVKNRVSHRAHAFEKAAVVIERAIERLRTSGQRGL